MFMAQTLGFGTVFFYCGIGGEVWFTAEVIGVGLTCLYVHAALRARRPALAGLFFSMAVLTRTPLLFSGTLFLLECLFPQAGERLQQPKRLRSEYPLALRHLAPLCLRAAAPGLAAAVNNFFRLC